MRQWVWWLLPAILIKKYFHWIGKFNTDYKGERCPCERLDDELLIIWYPTNGWYKRRGLALPSARQGMTPPAEPAAGKE